MTRTSCRPLSAAWMIAFCLSAAVALRPAPAAAEPPDAAGQPEASPLSLSLSPSHQFDAPLGRGGKIGVSRYLFDLTASKPLAETLGIGLHAAYEYADYHFSAPVFAGGAAPWGKEHHLELGGNIAYDLTPEWSIYVAPSVQLSREDGAGWGNALAYGGDLTVTKDFGPNVTLGLGVEGFSDLEQVWFLPLFVVNWKITDRLTLANPSRPGPAGQDGLELVYRAAGWETAAGAAYLSTRFRLRGSGPFRDGVAEISSIPAWARLSRTLGRHFVLDLYAGAMFAGEVDWEDRNGNDLASDRYNPAPFVALTVSGRI